MRTLAHVLEADVSIFPLFYLDRYVIKANAVGTESQTFSDQSTCRAAMETVITFSGNVEAVSKNSVGLWFLATYPDFFMFTSSRARAQARTCTYIHTRAHTHTQVCRYFERELRGFVSIVN